MQSRLTLLLVSLLLPIAVYAAPTADDITKGFIDKYSNMSKVDFAIEQTRFLNEMFSQSLEREKAQNKRIAELEHRMLQLELKLSFMRNQKSDR